MRVRAWHTPVVPPEHPEPAAARADQLATASGGLPAMVRRTLRRAKYFAGDRPWLLPLNLRFTPEGTDRAIDDRTEIVIEGFPRSGNTFAVFAFVDAQPGDARVASHIHHLAPLRIAIRRGLPLLVVCREPVDCLASYLVAGPHARPAGVIAEYIHHHRGVWDLRSGMVLATFDQVTNDLGSVIDRVNARFGTDFVRFEHDPASVQRVFRRIDDYHATVHRGKEARRIVPTPREGRHDEAELYARALTDPLLADALAEANDVYRRLAGEAES